MSSSRDGVSDELRAPGASDGDEFDRGMSRGDEEAGGLWAHTQGGASSQPGHGSSKKKRRRPRSQRGKRRRPEHGGRPPHIDIVSRERIFQDIEGLLRQIREAAEESAAFSEAQLNEFTQAVTTFTKSLEEETDPISERARTDYQRVRERLSQALRG